MKITGIKLYLIGTGSTGARGAAVGESQYWGGGWVSQTLVANPMSVYPEYSKVRSSWMGEGRDLQPIFDTLIGESLPVNGRIALDEGRPGFGVELNREKLIPYNGR